MQCKENHDTRRIDYNFLFLYRQRLVIIVTKNLMERRLIEFLEFLKVVDIRSKPTEVEDLLI